jgi:hypothetical protein
MNDQEATKWYVLSGFSGEIEIFHAVKETEEYLIGKCGGRIRKNSRLMGSYSKDKKEILEKRRKWLQERQKYATEQLAEFNAKYPPSGETQ